MISRTALGRKASRWSTEVKFLSRFVKIEPSPATLEYGLIAGAMGLALLAVTPILASSLAAVLGR
jgi:Flp pilus assembly pilin Flp